MTEQTYAPSFIEYAVVDSKGRVLTSGLTMHTDGLVPPGYTLLDRVAPVDTWWDFEKKTWEPIGEKPEDGWEFDWNTHQWKDPRTLEDIKSKKVLEINAAFDVASAALTAGYPVAERLTWPMQQAEALAWGADNTTPTPFLDGLAAARGITPEEIRQKALEVVQQFINGSQQLIGTRQRLRDAVDAATTREEVEAVAWPT